jgi:uncharacterized protein (TIGR00288 family)
MLPILKKKKTIAVFVDGPNILRKEFRVDLRKLKALLEKYGKIKIAKVFLNQYAPEKLIEAVSNEGYEVVIGMSKVKDESADVDVYMAVEAMVAVHDKSIDIIAIATRDADFLPLIYRAKEHGKEVIIIGREPAFSKALQHAADHVINLSYAQKDRACLRKRRASR